MLKYGKRILTVLLALVMAVGFCGLLANPAQAAQSSKVVSQQVSLGDDLTMNFAVSVAPDNQDGTLTVSVAGEEVGSYAVSSMTPDENGHYCVSAELAAAQMTDTVNLTLTDGDETVFSKDYSVRNYALVLLDDTNGFSDAVKTMAKAMLNYGAAAQMYFEHNTGSLANVGYVTENNVDLSTVEAPAVETSGKVEGLAFYGASLVFRGKVALRYYFDAPNGVDSFTFSAGDKTYEAKEKGDYYYIEIPGITPENYGKAVTVTAGTVDNTISVSYSPMTYLVRMYGKTGNESLKALVQNMYSYHTSAVEYIAQTEQDSEVELPYSPVFYSMYQYEEFIGNINPVSLGTLFGTDDEVNENAVIEVSVETVTGTASGEYTPAYNATEWSSGAIQLSGTGKVKITLNNVSVELTVENTSLDYPYNHKYPTFYPMYTSEQYYIGNCTEKLGALFMPSGDTIDEASVITLGVVIPEGSNASVTYSEDFAASDWSNVDLTFSGTGAVELRLNGGEPLTLVVEDTAIDYPYTHNTPSFQPVDMTKNLIGNAKVYLDKLFNPYSEVNEASVITVDIQTMSDTVSAEYIPAEKPYDWKSGAIVFSGTGDVQISINDCSLTLTVENTTLNYPYVHVYPEFEAQVSGTGYYIGADCDVYLSSLFTTSFSELGQDAVVTLSVDIPEDSEVSVTYDSEFAAADWENVKLRFVGNGAVNITLNNATVQLTVENSLISEPYTHPKFVAKYENTGEYYIGNQGTVYLGSLFERVDALETDAVINIRIDYQDENGTWSGRTENNLDFWEESTLTFDQTGPVKITVNGTELQLIVEESDICTPYTRPAFSVKEEYADGNYYIGNQYPVQLQTLFSSSGVDEFSVITVNVETVEGDVTGVYTSASSYDEWGYGYITLAGTGKVKITVNNASIELTVEDSEIGTPYNRPDFTCELDAAKTYYIGNETNLALSGFFRCTQSMDYKSVFKVAVIYPDGTTETKYWTNATDNGWEYCSVYTGEAAGELKISVNGCEAPVLIVENTDFTTPYVRPELTPAVAATGLYIGKDVPVSLNSLYHTDGVDSINAVFEVSIAYGSDTPTTVFAEAHENGEWWNYPLTFTQEGEVTVTVNGKSAITLTVDNSGESVPYLPMAKFDLVFENTNDYLYRVGNANAVKLSSLFTLASGDPKNGVTVNVEALNGANVVCTYNAEPTGDNWASETLQFTGTGPVKVTINETELYLEVVDGKNVTTAESATANNVVLLNDISGTFTVSNGYTFYGNGFTVTLPTSSVTKVGAGFTGYISIGAAQDDGIANGGHLDNVRIEGPVYPEMYIYRDQAKITDSSDSDYGDGNNTRYFKNSVIVYGGNCTISNCYISGSRTPVCLRGGNTVLIENTTLFGGAYANLQICAGSTVTLRDLTTVQVDVPDSYGKEKKAHGLGIAVDSNVVDIYIEGELKQHNWLCKAQWDAIVPSTYQKSFPAFFTDSAFSKHWHYLDGGTDPYVNLTMLFACNWDKARIHDNRTVEDYDTCDATIAGVSGGVYSKINTVNGNAITAAQLQDPGYVSTGFNPVAPKLNFDNTANHDEDDDNDANDTYCVFNQTNGTLKIGVAGNSKVIDLSGVKVEKNGQALPYAAYLNGNLISGTSVTIDVANGTSQKLTFKATGNAGYDREGNVLDGEIAYTWTVTVNIAVLSYPAPEWKMDTQFDTSECYYVYYKTSQGYGEAVPLYQGIKVNYYDKTGKLVEKDFSGTTDTPTGSGNSNANEMTYTLADGSKLTMKFSSGWKSGATTHQFAVYNNKLYLYPQSLDNDNYVRAKTTNQDFDVKVSYTFTDPNGQSISTTVQWYNAKANNGNVSTVQWKTFDTENGKEPSSCVTSDTLITLADGTQKRVDALTLNDKVLAWDFFTGSYAERNISLLVNHGEALYDVAYTKYSDGSELKIIGDHGVFDYDLNQFVYITSDNVKDYIGHRFVKQNLNGGYDIVTMTEGYVVSEYTEAWSITSAATSNVFASGLLTVAPPEDFYNWIEMDGKLQYNVEQFQKDVETYGLYTYEDFQNYVTYEQFIDWNGAYLKIPVEKGYFTFDYILELIELYKGWMPQT